MVKQSKTTTLPEIFTSCRFYVELTLEGSKEVDAYFMECSGFQVSQKVMEISEVTPRPWGKAAQGKPAASRGSVRRTKIPGNPEYSNITLKRGMTSSNLLWGWFKAIQEGNWSTKRKDGALIIYDQANSTEARFEFWNAWPVSYKTSGVNASGSDFEIEEIELACEGFRRKQ